ncbi:MAG TPA: hypothetical protein VGW31_09650 [Hanamia sp.]|nr:hypothetical protein [Hanamia sp.]
MKVISFFSRFTLICNIAFLLFIIFSKVESGKPVTGDSNTVIPVPFFKDLIITLGFSAIIINLIICIVYSVIVIIGKPYLLPKWLAAINFVFLILQFYFFFL